MLEVNNIRVCYNETPAIHDISIKVEKEEIIAVVGSNGGGKTTLLGTISGGLHPVSGKIIFMDRDISNDLPDKIMRMGIVHIQEGRKLFGSMTVLDNLLLGAFTIKNKTIIEERLSWVCKAFPILKERMKQRSGLLSGGEQQMLAIARGLMSLPRLLMLDEPSLGIMPIYTNKILKIVKKLRDEEAMSILIVEQEIKKALKIADRAYVVQNGHIILEGKGEELLNSSLIKESYLGI